MSLVNIESCPICSGNNFKKKFVCTDYLVSGEKFDLCSCNTCNFVFTKQFPDEKHIGKYYDSPEYISHSDTNKGFISKLYRCVRKYMLKRKLQIVYKACGSKTGKLLDIGCGTGYFLNTAKQKSWQISGIEKNEKARNYANTTFELNVQAEETLNTLENNSFDAITMWHVLEHLENLNGSMQTIYNLLADKGIAVIAVPNCSSYDAGHYKNMWAAYDTPRHLWHFTPQSLEKLANKHKLSVENKKTMPFDAFYIAMMSEKNIGSGKMKTLIKAIYIGSVGFLRSLFYKQESSSIIYILRKQS